MSSGSSCSPDGDGPARPGGTGRPREWVCLPTVKPAEPGRAAGSPGGLQSRATTRTDRQTDRPTDQKTLPMRLLRGRKAAPWSAAAVIPARRDSGSGFRDGQRDRRVDSHCGRAKAASLRPHSIERRRFGRRPSGAGGRSVRYAAATSPSRPQTTKRPKDQTTKRPKDAGWGASGS